MENLFAELGLDMQEHMEWLSQLSLDHIGAKTVNDLAELIPLAGDGDWEL